MYDMMCHMRVKATSRSVHHAFSKYLNLAHEGQEIVITKRGKPWAKLEPIQAEKPVRYPGEGALRVREESMELGVVVEDAAWEAFVKLELELSHV